PSRVLGEAPLPPCPPGPGMSAGLAPGTARDARGLLRREVRLPGDWNRGAGHVDENRGAGRAGLLEQAHTDLIRERVALAAVAGGAGGDDVVPTRAAALGPGDHVVDGEVGARAAVLAGPVVAGEHGPAGDLAPVRVARDPNVGDQADHHR